MRISVAFIYSSTQPFDVTNKNLKMNSSSTMIVKNKPLNSGLSLSGLSLSNKDQKPKKFLVNKNYKAIKAILKGGVSLSQEEEGIFNKLLGSSKFY